VSETIKGALLIIMALHVSQKNSLCYLYQSVR
jgi:hypothetical protein